MHDFQDAWGRAFHVKFTPNATNATYEEPITHKIVRSITYKLLIWSDGPNRRNEQGKGDDLVRADQVTCEFEADVSSESE